MFSYIVRQQGKFESFMESALTTLDLTAKSLADIKVTCLACRTDSIATTRDEAIVTVRDVKEYIKGESIEIKHEIWSSHDKLAAMVTTDKKVG